MVSSLLHRRNPNGHIGAQPLQGGLPNALDLQQLFHRGKSALLLAPGQNGAPLLLPNAGRRIRSERVAVFRSRTSPSSIPGASGSSAGWLVWAVGFFVTWTSSGCTVWNQRRVPAAKQAVRRRTAPSNHEIFANFPAIVPLPHCVLCRALL